MGSHAVGLGAHAPHRPPNVELSAVLLPPALRDKLVNHGFRMTADFTGLGPTELSKGEKEKRSDLCVTCRANGTPRRTTCPACWHAFLRAHHCALPALRARSSVMDRPARGNARGALLAGAADIHGLCSHAAGSRGPQRRKFQSKTLSMCSGLSATTPGPRRGVESLHSSSCRCATPLSLPVLPAHNPNMLIGLSIAARRYYLVAARGCLTGRPLPALFREKAQEVVKHVITFCSDMDTMLGGGVAVGEVTEFCGAPGECVTPRAAWRFCLLYLARGKCRGLCGLERSAGRSASLRRHREDPAWHPAGSRRPPPRSFRRPAGGVQ